VSLWVSNRLNFEAKKCLFINVKMGTSVYWQPRSRIDFCRECQDFRDAAMVANGPVRPPTLDILITDPSPENVMSPSHWVIVAYTSETQLRGWKKGMFIVIMFFSVD
jgi:hypothetical protein